MNHKEEENGIHINYTVITQLIDKNSKVLDLGCGNGVLLKKLIDEKQVTGTGIEIDQNSAIDANNKPKSEEAQKTICSYISELNVITSKLN